MLSTSDVIISAILERLKAIDASLQRLSATLQPIASPERDFFSPNEFAKLVNRRPFSVREWCRLGRIRARKRAVGRGGKLEWEIPVEELHRYRNRGLLPLERTHVTDRGQITDSA